MNSTNTDTARYTFSRCNSLLKPFHGSIEAIRAHHWQVYGDIYKGCRHGCVYCLYRYDDSFASDINVIENAPDVIRKELLDIGDIGICYIGPSSDVYQPIEKKTELFRNVLKVFCDIERPVFFSTKSPLVLRDIDILRELATGGLVETSITILGTSKAATRSLEPGTPSTESRWKAIQKLVNNGVSVSIHLAPFIDELLTDDDILKLAQRANDSGVSHIFGSVLGVRSMYWDVLSTHLSKINEKLPGKIASMYGGHPETYHEKTNAQSLLTHITYQKMNKLKTICDSVGINFVCEEIPALSACSLHEGIYRWKYPTVFDLAKFVSTCKLDKIRLPDLIDFTAKFKVLKSYDNLVTKLWNEQTLFLNTAIEMHSDEQGVYCVSGSNLVLGSGGVGTYE